MHIIVLTMWRFGMTFNWIVLAAAFPCVITTVTAGIIQDDTLKDMIQE